MKFEFSEWWERQGGAKIREYVKMLLRRVRVCFCRHRHITTAVVKMETVTVQTFVWQCKGCGCTGVTMLTVPIMFKER